MPYANVTEARKKVKALKGMTTDQVRAFIGAYNSLEKEGTEESSAIAQAIAAANKVEKSSNASPIEKASTSDVERDHKGNLVYRGTKFPGYNKPMRSNRDGKQGMVLARKGDQIKVVHFGDPSMADNQSVEQNDAYYARHGTTDDKFSAKYWSNKWLWGRGKQKGKGPKPFYTLNKSKEDMSSIKTVIKATDEEQRISVEVVYEPYVLDAHNEWMSPETIAKACENFNKNLEKGNVIPNMYHGKEKGAYKKTENFDILKSYIIPVDCTVGDTPISAGTWLAELHWKDDNAWELRKSNFFHSTSIGAKGSVNDPITSSSSNTLETESGDS